MTKPPSLSYSEHISNESVTQHGNVISESNLKAVQAVIQKLHPAVLRQHEESKFSVGDVVRSGSSSSRTMISLICPFNSNTGTTVPTAKKHGIQW